MSAFGDPTYYRDQLAEIDAAITAIATRGQRYRIGTRELWRADLEWLTSERKRLQPLAAREASCGIRIRRAVPL